jgi:hypothetical protein
MAWQLVEFKDCSTDDHMVLRYTVTCDEGVIYWDVTPECLIVHVDGRHMTKTSFKALRDFMWESGEALCEKYGFDDVFMLSDDKKICDMFSYKKAKLVKENVIGVLNLYVLEGVR